MYDSQQNLSLKFFEVQNYLIIFHQSQKKKPKKKYLLLERNKIAIFTVTFCENA